MASEKERNAARPRKRELERLQGWLEAIRFDRTKALKLARARHMGIFAAGPPSLNPTANPYVMRVSW